MQKLKETKLNNFSQFSEKWRHKGLTIAFMVILLCFLIGNDHYNVYALVRKNRAILPNRKIVSSKYIPKPTVSLLFSSLLGGGDACANATNVTMTTFNDTGNTTGANDTISNYLYYYGYYSYAYPGPDQFYKIVLTTTGSIGATINPGAAYDPGLFLTATCPAGTGNSVDLLNAADSGLAGAAETLPVTSLPAGTYYLAVDSYYASGAAGSAGPYSITINSLGLAPTAAETSVSGRVVNAKGRGIARVVVSVTNTAGQTRFVTTNPFGYYRIDSLNAGGTYIFNASSKSYKFPSGQVVSLNQDLEDFNFTALP